MTDLFPITTADKLACAKRELKMRQSVYPRWIKVGKISNEKAEMEIRLIAEIVRDYEAKIMEEKR